MMLVVILVSILAGFGAGYATRALGVRARVERDPLHRPTVLLHSGGVIHW